MIKLNAFNRKFSVKNLAELGSPRIASLTDLELPVGSILHYLPTPGITEIGPEQSLPTIEKTTKMPQVRHITKLTDKFSIIGRPKNVAGNINKDITQYHRINRRLKRLKNERTLQSSNEVLVIENYAPLNRLYRYPESVFSWYEKWYNIALTLIGQIDHDSKAFERQSFIRIEVPDVLPSISKLNRAEIKRTNATLDTIRDHSTLFILELWTWLGDNSSQSIFSLLDDDTLRHLNIILSYRDRFVNINLGELLFWSKGHDDVGLTPAQMQRRTYKTILNLIMSVAEGQEVDELSKTDMEDIVGESAPDESDLDEEEIKEEIKRFNNEAIDEESDFEVIKTTEDDEGAAIATTITIDNGIENACLKYINARSMSVAEYEKLLELSKSYKDIKSPYGDTTLEEEMVVTEEMVAVEEEVLIEDDPTLLDPDMAKTTTKQFNTKYAQEVLHKDIIASTLAIQKGGFAVTGYAVDEYLDAGNHLETHTVNITPVRGAPSTIRFNIPKLDDDGYWVANDVKSTMRDQRVDYYLLIGCIYYILVSINEIYRTQRVEVLR